ncbi:hypothetical protein DAEQUDRAFT_764274 [Daedalea quercina L-15889]|uniref:F-box domain-containing protein n=1 Tax=Daedalea quercina L-15889 TaxID=1314783 RepID=A0A165RQS2_9APHY|nr:hypothetical protein DAEQUDRAFT_764274 [Daedalea quercina L-15889]
MKMVPYLPAELIDHIIDYLHDDFRSLATCALTCRQWLPAAHFHTFGSVVLWPDTCKTFAELLAASPELALVVHSVEMRSLVHGSRVWQLVDLSFLDVLTAVTDLKLNTIRVADAVHEALIRTLLTVRKLAVDGCWFATLQDFAALASSFRGIESLAISFLLGDPNAAVVSPPPSLPASLRTIELGDLEWDRMPAVELLDWLGGVPDPQQIIGLSCHVAWEVWPAQMILGIFGSHLQHLELVVKTEVSLDRILGKAEFSLSQCTNLQTFALRLWLAEMCVPENQDLPWVPRLLSQLHCPRLYKITLSFYAEDMTDLRTLASENAVRQLSKAQYFALTALDWTSISATLARADFSALRELVIEGRGPKGILEAYIRREHPELHERGVVTLT